MRRMIALAVGLSLLGLGAASLWRAGGGAAAPSTRAAIPASGRRAAESTPAPNDDRRILGTWHDRYKGRRTMTLRDDGTATMVCELEGLNARLFTPVLNLELRWQLDNDVLKRVIVGGEPADKVRFVINLMGAHSEEKLLALTDNELHLLDNDGQTEYHWTRAAAELSAPLLPVE